MSRKHASASAESSPSVVYVTPTLHGAVLAPPPITLGAPPDAKAKKATGKKVHKHHHSEQTRDSHHHHHHKHRQSKHHKHQQEEKHRHHSKHHQHHHSKHHSDTEREEKRKKTIEEELEEELASDDMSLLVAAAQRIETPYLRPDIFYSGDSTPHGSGSASTARSSMEALQEPAAVPPDALRPRGSKSKDAAAQTKRHRHRHKQARSLGAADDGAEERRRESHERVQSSLAAIRLIEEQYMHRQVV